MKLIIEGIALFLFVAILSAINLAIEEGSGGYLVWVLVFIVLIALLFRFLRWWKDL